MRSSCCHSDSDSLCDSRWSLVMKTYGSTQCMRVNNAVPAGPRARERRLLLTITIYFINPSGKLKLSFDRTTKNISQ